MTLSLGFSPCPNDTFIFDALINGKIDTYDINFKILMEDVETLNQRAMHAELDMTKLSYAALAHCSENYKLLQSGSALGSGVGPLVISKKENLEITESSSVAIPGKFTTAHFLFGMKYSFVKNKIEMPFNEIEAAVLSGKVDAGVIIHENRFTYQLKGLHKVIDLGEFWETTTQLPIPLGGIVVKKSLPIAIQQQLEKIMFDSVAFAFAHPESSKKFVAQYAQEMSPAVMQQHIDLYVNEYTKSLGEKGNAAVNYFSSIKRTSNGSVQSK